MEAPLTVEVLATSSCSIAVVAGVSQPMAPPSSRPMDGKTFNNQIGPMIDGGVSDR